MFSKVLNELKTFALYVRARLADKSTLVALLGYLGTISTLDGWLRIAGFVLCTALVMYPDGQATTPKV